MKPSKQNAAGFKELGINVADFKKGTLTLPEILNKIKTNTAGWTKEQRAAAIATAFGTEAQAGMNALVSQGGDALTDLTNKTEKATGSTKKIADTMNNTKAAQIARFKESLHVLAITIGDKLTPTLMPLVKDATQVVKSFSKLDTSTQQTIVKTAALAAAVGPLLSILGGASRGLGVLGTAFSFPVLGITRMVGASKQGATGLGILKAGFSKTAYASGDFATKTAKTSKSVVDAGSKATSTANNYITFGSKIKTAAGSLLTLAAANPVATTAIGLTTAAVIAGGIYWETYGKKAYQSQQRVNRWGSDVGVAADKSLSKFKTFSDGANSALNSTSKVSKSTASSMANDFSKMANEVKKNTNKANKEIDETLKNLPNNVSKSTRDAIEKEKAANNERAKAAQQNSDNVSNIYRRAANDHRKLTADERTYVGNVQQSMQRDEINSLNITGKHKRLVYAAMNADTRNMTEKEKNYFQSATRQESIDAFTSLEGQIKDRQSYWDKTISQEKKSLKKRHLTESQYNDAVKKMYQQRNNDLGRMDKAYIKLNQKAGYTTDTAKKNLRMMGSAFHSFSQDAVKGSESIQRQFENSGTKLARVTNGMSKDAQKAGNDWNRMVFNPKTGKIKTNAQDIITKTAQTGTGWRKLFFDLKHANLTSNAKSMIGVAALQSGKWNQLSFKEQKATIKSNAGKEIADSLKASGQWDKMSFDEKMAIVTSNGGKELADLILKNGQWNSLTFKDQKALVQDKATKPVMKALDQLGIWNKLTPVQQEAIVTAKGKSEVNDLLVKMGIWNKLSFTQKMLQVKDEATQPIMQMLDKAGIWNNLTMEQQEAIVNAKGLPQVEQLLQKFNIWNNMSFKQQEMFVQDNATLPIMEAMNKYKLWKDMPEEEKNAIINSKGGPELVDTILKYQNWDSLPDSVKNAILKSQGKSDIADMVIKYHLWSDLPEKEKRLLANDDDARQKLNQAGYDVEIYNHKPVNIKELEGNNVGLLDKLKTGQKGIIVYNGHKVWVKKLDGDNAQVLNTVKTASNKINDYNTNTKVHGKKFPANNVELLNKSQAAQTSLHNFNGINPIPKILQSRDHASGPAHSAKRAVDAFPTGTKIMNLVTNFISKHFKKEKGDTDFTEGTAMVNDQRGPIFRELIRLPNGDSFVPQGRNVVMALPRHTQIIPARETNRLLGGIPQYANGTPGYSRVIKEFTDLSPNLLQAGDNITTTNNRGGNVTNSHPEFHINVTVNTNSSDGNSIGRLVSEEIERQFRQEFNNQSDAWGGGSIA